jgi:murein DD-endopeptidase MepM/ murein hydrolase activator NlpD
VFAGLLALLVIHLPSPGYSKPVPGAVVRAYEAPVTAFSAGHRGVDLGTTPGEAVGAAADGEVSYAGTLAGRGVVVITHADGVRTEYEPVIALVVAHERVSAGETIGLVYGTHGACTNDECLHWGARRGDEYIDPLTLLAPARRVRLLPWDG